MRRLLVAAALLLVTTVTAQTVRKQGDGNVLFQTYNATDCTSISSRLDTGDRGVQCWDTDDEVMYTWSGSAWAASAGGGGAPGGSNQQFQFKSGSSFSGAAEVEYQSTAGSLVTKNDLVNVLHSDFGAACDGTGDDSTEINSAADYAATTGGTLYVPPGVNCRITSEVEIHGDFMMCGATITYAGTTGTALQVIASSYDGNTGLLNVKGGLPSITHASQQWSGSTPSTDIGIEFVNFRGDIDACGAKINEFSKGVHFLSQGNGNVDINWIGGEIRGNFVGLSNTTEYACAGGTNDGTACPLQTECTGGGVCVAGWFNEFKAYGIKFGWNEADPDRPTGSAHISLTGLTTGSCNGNAFYGTNIEGDPEYNVDLAGGCNNVVFRDNRWEAGGTSYVRFGSSTRDNVIDRGVEAYLLNVTDTGTRNIVKDREIIERSTFVEYRRGIADGDAADSYIALMPPTNSDSVFKVYPTTSGGIRGGTLNRTTGWVFDVNASTIEGKAGGDANERFRITGAGPSMRFGDGTTTLDNPNWTVNLDANSVDLQNSGDALPRITMNTSGQLVLGDGATQDVVLRREDGLAMLRSDDPLLISQGDPGVDPLVTDELTVEDNSDSVVTLLSPTGFYGRLYFGDDSGYRRGSVIYNHEATGTGDAHEYMRFTVGDADAPTAVGQNHLTLYADLTAQFHGYQNCNLETDATGNMTCGTDAGSTAGDVNVPTDTDGDGVNDFIRCADFDGDGTSEHDDYLDCHNAVKNATPHTISFWDDFTFSNFDGSGNNDEDACNDIFSVDHPRDPWIALSDRTRLLFNGHKVSVSQYTSGNPQGRSPIISTCVAEDTDEARSGSLIDRPIVKDAWLSFAAGTNTADGAAFSAGIQMWYADRAVVDNVVIENTGQAALHVGNSTNGLFTDIWAWNAGNYDTDGVGAIDPASSQPCYYGYAFAGFSFKSNVYRDVYCNGFNSRGFNQRTQDSIERIGAQGETREYFNASVTHQGQAFTAVTGVGSNPQRLAAACFVMGKRDNDGTLNTDGELSFEVRTASSGAYTTTVVTGYETSNFSTIDVEQLGPAETRHCFYYEGSYPVPALTAGTTYVGVISYDNAATHTDNVYLVRDDTSGTDTYTGGNVVTGTTGSGTAQTGLDYNFSLLSGVHRNTRLVRASLINGTGDSGSAAGGFCADIKGGVDTEITDLYCENTRGFQIGASQLALRTKIDGLTFIEAYDDDADAVPVEIGGYARGTIASRLMVAGSKGSNPCLLLANFAQDTIIADSRFERCADDGVKIGYGNRGATLRNVDVENVGGSGVLIASNSGNTLLDGVETDNERMAFEGLRIKGTMEHGITTENIASEHGDLVLNSCTLENIGQDGMKILGHMDAVVIVNSVLRNWGWNGAAATRNKVGIMFDCNDSLNSGCVLASLKNNTFFATSGNEAIGIGYDCDAGACAMDNIRIVDNNYAGSYSSSQVFQFGAGTPTTETDSGGINF